MTCSILILPAVCVYINNNCHFATHIHIVYLICLYTSRKPMSSCNYPKSTLLKYISLQILFLSVVTAVYVYLICILIALPILYFYMLSYCVFKQQTENAVAQQASINIPFE